MHMWYYYVSCRYSVCMQDIWIQLDLLIATEIFALYNQDWVGITCAGEPLYSSSFVYCVCLSVES